MFQSALAKNIKIPYVDDLRLQPVLCLPVSGIYDFGLRLRIEIYSTISSGHCLKISNLRPGFLEFIWVSDLRPRP